MKIYNIGKQGVQGIEGRGCLGGNKEQQGVCLKIKNRAQENRGGVLKQGEQGVEGVKIGAIESLSNKIGGIGNQGVQGPNKIEKIGSVPGSVRLPNFPSQYRATPFHSFWNKYKKDRTISVRSLIGYQLCLYIYYLNNCLSNLCNSSSRSVGLLAHLHFLVLGIVS